MPSWSELRGLVFAWVLIAASGATLALCLRPFTGSSTTGLPPQRRRAVPWTGGLVLLAFLVFSFVPEFILPYIDPAAVSRWVNGSDGDLEAGRSLARMVANLIALPLQIATWRALALLVDGPRSVFGFVPKRLTADYLAAFRMWLWLTPVVYAVHIAAAALYALIVRRPPDEHPLIQVLQTGAPTLTLVLLVFLQAVVVAPIREEFFFRGIMQPFLTDRTWGGGAAVGMAVLAGMLVHKAGAISVAEPMTVLTVAAPALFVLAMLPILLGIDTWPRIAQLPVLDPQVRRQATAAIVGTALLFANCHANVWPTPVPLFVLALGLGWLAYRTQSVVAPIFLHMLFNAIVFLAIPPPPA